MDIQSDGSTRRIRKGAAAAVMKWVRDNGGHPTTDVGPTVDGISSTGGTPLVVAELVDGQPARALGVIHLKDIVKQGMRERFDEMRRMGIRTVMITGDNPLTARAIANEAGVDDFLAEAKPEDKLALIRKEQEGGRLVAMTGDGTNDAPALAQADVGVSMNTGTSAAKEAGNMVDLDSDPTKLIEIVEIGKQLLITRGALTTFSIANDIAKYFAIIPAMFAAVYPSLDALNIMGLHSPASAITSAIIFNALIIVALIPLALRGVRYRPEQRLSAADPQPAGLRRGRHHRAVHRHQAHRPTRRPVHSGVVTMRLPSWLNQHLAGLAGTARVHSPGSGSLYPLVMVVVAKFPGLNDNAQGSIVEGADGNPVGSEIIGQLFRDADGTPVPTYFQSRPSAAGDGYDPTSTAASNLGPESIEDTLPVPGAVDDEGNPDEGNAEPAHPGLRAQRRGCATGGRGRPSAVLHLRRDRGGPAGLLQRWPERTGHPGGFGEPGLPGLAVPPRLRGRHGRMWRARSRTTPAACSQRSVVTRRPIRPCRRTRSPPAGRAWIRTSARRTPDCRSPASLGNVPPTRRRYSVWSTSTLLVGRWASWASPGSTCSC